jgi:ribosomal protein S18 acetylase RimI-like enzyme
MGLREASTNDIPLLISLYRSFFDLKDLFLQDDEKISNYLELQIMRNIMYVFEESGLLKGAVILVNVSNNATRTHKVWKYRHFAFDSLDIAKELLEHSESHIKNQSETSKVELIIPEHEEGLEFYRKSGYEHEAALKNHYQWDETSFVLGKSFQNN